LTWFGSDCISGQGVSRYARGDVSRAVKDTYKVERYSSGLLEKAYRDATVVEHGLIAWSEMRCQASQLTEEPTSSHLSRCGLDCGIAYAMRLSQAATQENGDDEQRKAHLVPFARDEMKSFLQDGEWITWVEFAVMISSQFSQTAY
jgi:hypothetical protein